MRRGPVQIALCRRRALRRVEGRQHLQEAVQDALGNRATTVFDSHNRTQATIDQLDRRTTFLYDNYRIVINAVTRPDYQGVRVTPNVYTTLEEIDTFTAAMEDLLKNGLPATA